MAKVISTTGEKKLWSFLLRWKNGTILSINGGENSQITEQSP